MTLTGSVRGIAYTVFTAVLAATASRLPYTFYRDRPV